MACIERNQINDSIKRLSKIPTFSLILCKSAIPFWKTNCTNLTTTYKWCAQLGGVKVQGTLPRKINSGAKLHHNVQM